MTALCQSNEEDSEELVRNCSVVGQKSCRSIELQPEDSIGSLGTGDTDGFELP